jgi:hypothetical protein
MSNFPFAHPYEYSVLPLCKMESSYLDFFRDNLLLIAVIGIGIFGYFLLLIRKRKRQEFLHKGEKKDS